MDIIQTKMLEDIRKVRENQSDLYEEINYRNQLKEIIENLNEKLI